MVVQSFPGGKLLRFLQLMPLWFVSPKKGGGGELSRIHKIKCFFVTGGADGVIQIIQEVCRNPNVF